VDTQWPRFEVFEQDGPDQPHRHTGTAPAVDAETALHNARDVFARRPECTSLWVAPQNQVYAWTSAALQADPSWQSDTVVLARSASPYEVFVKDGQRQSDTYVTHVGTVEARSPTEALRLALAQFNTNSVSAWWLVPARAIRSSAR
jgi:ring-1,2-phenylacetyl-CoA epoxidase subunit PaaB